MAKELRALDVIVVRKLGVPFQPELAFGAIGEDAVRIMNEFVLWAAGIGPYELDAVEHHERTELTRLVRGERERARLAGRVAVVGGRRHRDPGRVRPRPWRPSAWRRTPTRLCAWFGRAT